MTDDDKEIIRFRRLVDCQRKTVRLRNLLPGNHPSRAAVNDRLTDLRDELLRLEEKLDKNWIGDADKIKKEISTTNGLLQKTVDDIKKDLDNIEKITKALGYIDKILGIAAALV